MKSKKILLILGLLFLLSTTVYSQADVCGNTNYDPAGNLDISDIVFLLVYLANEGPAPQNMAICDVDNREGVAIADAAWLARYFFDQQYENYPLDCDPSLSYTFSQSTEDTIYIPYVPAIGEATEVITLPFSAHFSPQTIGFYLPLLYDGAGSSGNFEPGTFITDLSSNFFVSDGGGADTGIFHAAKTQQLLPPNPVQLFELEYNRTAPGSGAIYLDPVDRNPLWRFAFVHDDGDMVLPVIKLVEISGYILLATPNDPTFSAIFGFPPPDQTYELNITSDGFPINWSATVSDPWIVIDVNSGITPSTMNVSIDVTDLPSAIYNGTITISDIDHPFDEPTIVDVSLNLRSPFPSMDANCSGEFNIGDLTYLINYLFGIPTGPPPCNPCTGTFPESTNK